MPSISSHSSVQSHISHNLIVRNFQSSVQIWLNYVFTFLTIISLNDQGAHSKMKKSEEKLKNFDVICNSSWVIIHWIWQITGIKSNLTIHWNSYFQKTRKKDWLFHGSKTLDEISIFCHQQIIGVWQELTYISLVLRST